MEFFFIVMLMIVIGVILTLIGLDDSIKPKGYDTSGKDKPPKEEVSKITLGDDYPELQKFIGLENAWYTDEKGDLFSLHIELIRRYVYDSCSHQVNIHKFSKLSLCSELISTFEIKREVGGMEYRDRLLDTDSIITETISGYENLPKGTLKKSERSPKDIYWKEILESQFKKEQEEVKLCEEFVKKVKVRYTEYKEVCNEFGRKPEEPITDIDVFVSIVHSVGLNDEYYNLLSSFKVNGYDKTIKLITEILNRKE